MSEDKLKEIIKIAYKLKWIFPSQYLLNKDRKQIYSSYPIMILSEVEKCMIALYDDNELNRMREWYNKECEKEKALTQNEEGAKA